MLIHCENLQKNYTPKGKIPIGLHSLNLQIPAGQFTLIHGPSGSGKTTLLLILGGMLQPDSGNYHFDGTDLYAQSAAAINQYRATQIGFVFQTFHLIPYLSILDNVLTATPPTTNTPKSQWLDRAKSLLEEVGLLERLHHKPSEISAGEKQRVALARALLNQPKLLLADEPTGNLDPDNAARVYGHISRFHKQGLTTPIVVSHGTQADSLADRIYHLDQGRITSGN